MSCSLKISISWGWKATQTISHTAVPSVFLFISEESGYKSLKTSHLFTCLNISDSAGREVQISVRRVTPLGKSAWTRLSSCSLIRLDSQETSCKTFNLFSFFWSQLHFKTNKLLNNIKKICDLIIFYWGTDKKMYISITFAKAEKLFCHDCQLLN